MRLESRTVADSAQIRTLEGKLTREEETQVLMSRGFSSLTWPERLSRLYITDTKRRWVKRGSGCYALSVHTSKGILCVTTPGRRARLYSARCFPPVLECTGITQTHAC